MSHIQYGLYEKWPEIAILADGSILMRPKTLTGAQPQGHKIGKVYLETDGYYVWAPHALENIWSARTLHLIADALDELNASWDAQVKEKEESNG